MSYEKSTKVVSVVIHIYDKIYSREEIDVVHNVAIGKANGSSYVL